MIVLILIAAIVLLFALCCLHASKHHPDPFEDTTPTCGRCLYANRECIHCYKRHRPISFYDEPCNEYMPKNNNNE